MTYQTFDTPTTPTAFYLERKRFYHRAVIAGAVFAAHIFVILGLLALFAT